MSYSSSENEKSTLQDWIGMVTEISGYHELLWQMLLRDIKLRYKQAVMGFIWAIFLPIMVVCSGCVIKYVMATLSGQPMNTVLFANMSVKAIGWAFFIGIVTNGSNALVSNIGLITKIYFPREVLSLSAVATQFFDSTIGSIVLAIMLISINCVAWTWNLLWIPLLIILLTMTSLALCMFLSCAMVFYRDVKYILSILISFGIFFTPVFYETNQLGRPLNHFLMLNPVAPILEALRLVIVDGHNLFLPVYDAAGVTIWTPWYLLYAVLMASLGLAFSWRYFHKKEKLYAEYI